MVSCPQETDRLIGKTKLIYDERYYSISFYSVSYEGSEEGAPWARVIKRGSLGEVKVELGFPVWVGFRHNGERREGITCVKDQGPLHGTNLKGETHASSWSIEGDPDTKATNDRLRISSFSWHQIVKFLLARCRE